MDYSGWWAAATTLRVSTSPAPSSLLSGFISARSECQLLWNADFAILIAPCWFASKQKHSAARSKLRWRCSLPPTLFFLLKAFLDDSEYCTLAYCLAHGRFFPSGAPSFAISILPLIKINDDCKNHQRYNVLVELIWMRFPAQGTIIGKSHLCFVPARW